MRFSERMGFEPVRQAIQKDDMDPDLRIGLWNVISFLYFNIHPNYDTPGMDDFGTFLLKLWMYHFKRPINDMPGYWQATLEAIRFYFFSCPWFRVYNFVEFVVQNPPNPDRESLAMQMFQDVLVRELSAYRFIGDTLAPITSEAEIASIEMALQLDDVFSPVAAHLNQALKLLSDHQQPDYKNSIKESISAVESMASLIAGKNKAELSSALDRIKDKLGMHTAFADALKKLYNYASDEDGIRHAALEEKNLDQEDAVFMLVSCSAFVNYLKVKADKAGIPLTPVA